MEGTNLLKCSRMRHKGSDFFVSEWRMNMFSSFQDVADHVKIEHHDNIATFRKIVLIRIMRSTRFQNIYCFYIIQDFMFRNLLPFLIMRQRIFATQIMIGNLTRQNCTMNKRYQIECEYQVFPIIHINEMKMVFSQDR